MTTDHFRYDLLTRDALRGVLRHVLTESATKGLVGDHHFYITFLTKTPGVKLSPRLTSQYPEEMTIILQHQFWDLQVTQDQFEVGLSFNGIPERLVVPFAAIKSFFDPSVQFGLQFETGEDAEKAEPAGSKATNDTARADITPVPARPEKAKDAAKSDADDDGDGPDDKGPGDASPRQGAEVVRLDRFRKK
jgi:hypothetical protein